MVLRRSAFASLRANADTTSLARVNGPFADAPVTAGVLSAFAKGRRPTYDFLKLK
jgi:hypothetical protein